jgi:molybdopterin synthase sulfur carrier subunit
MIIRLRLFAFFRQEFGAPEVAYEIADGSSVGDLLESIFKKYPSLEKSRGHTVVTINRVPVKMEEKIHDGDEIVILPPVSGG